MQISQRRIALACAATIVGVLGIGAHTLATASSDTTKKIGRQADGSVLLPSGQSVMPAGTTVELPTRVSGLTLSPDDHTAVVHAAIDSPSLFLIDLAQKKLVESFTGAPSVSSYDGVAYTPDGKTVISSGGSGQLAITPVRAHDGYLIKSTILDLPDSDKRAIACCNPYPGGIATSADSKIAYVALSKQNALGVIDVASATETKTIPVGNAPHSVVVVGNYAWVTNEGGRPAKAGDTTNLSGGTAIVSDPWTGAAVTGTVSIVDLKAQRQVGTIPVGLHPTALTRVGKYIVVTNTDSDSLSVIDMDLKKVVQTISVSPFPGAPYGSQPNGVTALPDGRLAVTLGGDNAVGVIRWSPTEHASLLQGLVPTGAFPVGLAIDAKRSQLVVASERGLGSLQDAEAGKKQRGVGGEVSTVQLIPLPSDAKLRSMTTLVFHLNKWDKLDRAPARPGVAPVAIPLHTGEPSLIKHVVYIVKENRTYDQVLGDLGRGNGDPSLAIFGKKVTPNSQAIATQFPLLDNFYDSARRSNDGHQWSMQGASPDYLEKGIFDQRSTITSGGTPPSSGFDALLYMPSGFIWENALKHGKTFMDFGEYTDEDQPPPAHSDKPSLEAHVAPEFSGFELTTPDQTRAQLFRNHMATWEAAGAMPDLITLTLPNDHTGGSNPLYPTPVSQVADNDAGLGQIVDSISHSQFWSSTAIFVVEDDSQGGVDHVDGHHAICLIASPYAKHGKFIDDTYYDQVDVVRTIEQILGLPPMSQSDLAANPMYDAFTNTADDTPFNAIAPLSATDIPNLPLSQLHGIRLEWAQAMLAQDFKHEDAVDPALLNRDIWYAVKGWNVPYPGDSRVLHPWEVKRSQLASLDSYFLDD